MPRTTPKRGQRSGRFEAASPLDDPGFLSAATRYVRGVDCLVPLLHFMMGRVDSASSEWRHLKMTHVMLDGMASSIAGQLVERGERLMFGRPPSVDLIAVAFDQGASDDHDALDLCLGWCRAIDDVLWYLEAVGVVGSRRSQKLLGDVLGDSTDEDVKTALALYMVRDAVGGLRSRMVALLSAAEDRSYLAESRKPVQRLDTPIHRLMANRALSAPND